MIDVKQLKAMAELRRALQIFATTLYTDDKAVFLFYHRDNHTTEQPAAMGLSVGDLQFYQNAPVYKTLEFDTAPTGELLTWLQKNADEQSDTEYLIIDITPNMKITAYFETYHLIDLK